MAPAAGLLHVERVMGTAVTLHIRGSDLAPGQLEHALVAAVGTLHEADRTFSTWTRTSALHRARRGEPVSPREQADLDTVEAACRHARRLTRGWFDPWAMPGGYDPTGLVKGWAAARALSALTSAGITDACVNAGGDLAAAGSAAPGAGGGWRVGIVDPERPSTLAGSLVARDVGVATSAGYERGSLAVDPFTGQGVERLAGATVVAPDLALADALAGAACAQGPASLDWLGQLPGVQALLVTLSGQVLVSPGWAEITAWAPAAAPGT